MGPDKVFHGTAFQQPQPTVVLTMDASLTGWGPIDTGSRSQDNRDLHINVLELKAVILAIRSFLHFLLGTTLAIQCNNSCINKQSGTVSLCKEAMDL